MNAAARLSRRLSAAPAAIIGIVLVLLLAGFAMIAQSESAYRALQEQEARVQAGILANGVTAALDFGDRPAAREVIDAIRVSRQVRSVGAYDAAGDLVAGYGRDGAAPPARLIELPGASARGISVSVPVMSRGQRIGTVALLADPEPVAQRLSRYAVIVLFILMAALVVVVLGVSQGALRRANRTLAERADALGAANEELQVQIGERGKAEDQLRQAHKMQALGQLTGGIAHDFNNLLTVILGSADMLRRPGIDEAKRLRFAEAVAQAASRAAALTGQLLAFARRQPLRPERIDVNALVRGMIDLLERTLGERVVIATELAETECMVETDRAQLESALLNIAVNARDAMPGGGSLTIRTQKLEDEAGGTMIALSAEDSGAGMDADTLSRAFEPFFTTKALGKGTGLGLSQVYGFVTQSGGEVRIDSRPGGGTTVAMLLPCSGSAANVPDRPDEAPATRGRTGRILLVEDNEEVGAFAAQLLQEMGHEVVRVRSGEEALARALAERFDLVFTDVVMPGTSGLELAERLAAERPRLPVILTTGYSEEIVASGAGGRPMILKPYRPEALAQAIAEALPAE